MRVFPASTHSPSPSGEWVNGAILLGWLISLISLLQLDLERTPWWMVPVLVLIRTQLQTGLFILGHDAMHGLLWPRNRCWNHRLGSLLLLLYAGLPYRQCLRLHHRHHRATATPQDPDFPLPASAGAFSWYRQFMGRYLALPQMAVLLGGWGLLALSFRQGSPDAPLDVLLFCTLPLMLSSLQLFVFGTYLPHRRQRGSTPRTKPDSLDLPPWLSLLACFHFGYHREHHDQPELRWFQLPAARRVQRSLTLSSRRR